MTTEEELDLEYLRRALQVTPLVPHPWNHADRNVGAFRSKEELVAWFGRPPGVRAEPHRDRRFYPRELSHVSRVVRPEVIVEFGTNWGCGACLLHWLNPSARLITVDIAERCVLPSDPPTTVQIGYMAQFQGVPCEYVRGESRSFAAGGVGLCFVDADHSYDAVVADTRAAWANRAVDRWAIVWHDYDIEETPGVVQAVDEFCAERGLILQRRLDSDTVWVEG